MHQERVRVSFIGALSALPKSLQNQIGRSLIETAQNQAITASAYLSAIFLLAHQQFDSIDSTNHRSF